MASLQGPAADFVFELDLHVTGNYQIIVEELHQRFHVAETPQTCARQFFRRHLRQGESLKQFAAELKTLILKAFPRLDRCTMEQMMIKQFFDGLNDEDLRYHVEYLKMPRRLDEAVDLVYEHDEFKQIKRDSRTKVKTVQSYKQNDNGYTSRSPQKTKTRFDNQRGRFKQNSSDDRRTRANDVSSVQPGSTMNKGESSQSELKELRMLMMKIEDRMAKLEVGKSGKAEDQPKTCYKCGKTGHFQRFCREADNKVKTVLDADKYEESEQDITLNEDTCCQTQCDDCTETDSETDENFEDQLN